VQGVRVKNYEVLSLVGKGGMGAVYLARHTIIGRKAAIKFMRSDLAQDEGLVRRFVNEARAANAIGHPNIVDVLDVGRLPESGLPYMIMEWLEGETVARRMESCGRIPVDQAVEIARQTALAVGAANARGILHRDLKPENLLLVPDPNLPGRDLVKVLDFGVAKLLGTEFGEAVRTHTGRLMGTPMYMSPEQCRGLKSIDQRSDVYALGVVLYHMLCGRPPFDSEATGDLVFLQITQLPAPMAPLNPAIPPELEAVVLQALAKAPDDRFASMAELAGALTAALAGHPDQFRRRAAITVALAAAAAGIGAWAMIHRDAPPPPAPHPAAAAPAVSPPAPAPRPAMPPEVEDNNPEPPLRARARSAAPRVHRPQAAEDRRPPPGPPGAPPRPAPARKW
jgi:serine/threonine protein kinase